MAAGLPLPVWVVDSINAEREDWERVRAGARSEVLQHRSDGALQALEILTDILREKLEGREPI